MSSSFESVPTSPPSGFRDFIGGEAAQRALLIRRISEIYESYGFDPIDTPALESIQVLLGKGGGEENEKLVFKILKRGEKLTEALANQPSESSIADFGLRFDLTVPLARVVAHYRNKIRFPAKLYHIAPVWRAERSQKGRFREFYQCDVDILGSSHFSAEVEVIQAVVDAVSRIGGKEFRLHINDRSLLRKMAESFGFEGEKADQFAIILDKKDKLDPDEILNQWRTLKGSAISNDLEGLLSGSLGLDQCEKYSPEAVTRLRDILNAIEKLHLPLESLVFDPSLARGLGYYTGPVFELRHHSAGYSLGGGGRYDGLIGRFLKDDVPACGFSIGFERLLLLLSQSTVMPSKPLFIPIFSEDLRPVLMEISKSLREEGFRIFVYPDQAKLKTQFKYASEMDFRWILICGEDEWKAKSFKLKDFQSGTEYSVPLEALSQELKNRLNT